MTDYKGEFLSAMRSAGIDTQAEITADGTLQRFHVEGDRPGSKNGWAVLFDDDTPAGQYGCFKRGIFETWTSSRQTTLTTDQRTKQVEKIEQAKKIRRAEEEKIQSECRKWCDDAWRKAKKATGNASYLKSKGVQSYGLKQLRDSLLIPLRDIAGKLHGIQFIKADGIKKFKTGTQKQGNYFAIGKPKKKVLLLCEGYATGASLHECTDHAVAVCFDAGNLQPVAENLQKKLPGIKLIVCADNDQSGVGQQKAKEAAAAVGGLVVMPPDTGDDFNDLHQKKGSAAVKAIVEVVTNVADYPQRCGTVADRDIHRCPETLACGVVADKPTLPTDSIKSSSIDETVMRLAALPPLEYEKLRKEEASRHDVRTSSLDRAVKEAKRSSTAGTDLPFNEIIPWPEEIIPAEILSEITTAVRRFIICDKPVSIAVALWCAMTWFLEVIQVCPLAVITAPEKRCGKTQLLTVIGRLVCRAITASSISPAALYRSIDAWKPTLLIDEVDACMKDNEELRGIINSGHTRDSAFVIRTVGDTFVPTKFSTWGPKALSGIGHVADTLMDRAIILELRRKLPNEQVDRLRYAETKLFDSLSSKLARFADDYSEQVRQARPHLPPSLNDRAQDNWEPLLAIAMVAGDEWLKVATETALKLSSTEGAAQSIGVELLTDIQDVFEEKAVDRISTADLIKALCDDEEWPWATYNRGVSIKPRQLATRLKAYDIFSKTVRISSLSTPKGYEKKQFEAVISG